MAKRNNCACYKCSWFINVKSWCAAKEKNTTIQTACCNKFKER